MDIPIDKFLKEYHLAYQSLHQDGYQTRVATNKTSTTSAETETASVYQAVPISVKKSLVWFGGKFVSTINTAVANLFKVISK